MAVGTTAQSEIEGVTRSTMGLRAYADPGPSTNRLMATKPQSSCSKRERPRLAANARHIRCRDKIPPSQRGNLQPETIAVQLSKGARHIPAFQKKGR